VLQISLQSVINFITKVYWLQYKVLQISLQKFIDFTTKCYKCHYKSLLTSLQSVTNVITKVYWLHYKVLQISLQSVINFITKVYWLQYKVLQISLQKFIDFTTKCYKCHYKSLLTSLQHFVINSTNNVVLFGWGAISGHLLSHLAVSVHNMTKQMHLPTIWGSSLKGLSETLSSLMHLLSFRPSKAITSVMECKFVGQVDLLLVERHYCLSPACHCRFESRSDHL